MENQTNKPYKAIRQTEKFPYFSYLHLSHFSPPPTVHLLHYHEEFEIGICLEGSGIFIIDEQSYAFTKGDISVIYPDEVHIAHSNSDDTSTWDFITVKHNSLPFIPTHDFEECVRHGSGRILSGSKYPYIQNMIKMICFQLRGELPFRESITNALIAALVPAVAQIPVQAQETRSIHRHYLDDILPAIKYISQNYHEEINISLLAKLCHCSDTQLRRLFNAVLQTTPMNYLHNVRIDKAADLLRDPDIPITEVSLSVGYNTLSSFNRHFKDIKSITPSDYRKSAMFSDE